MMGKGMLVSELSFLRLLTTDGRLLFATRPVRLFAYGFLSVILALYLAEVGLTTVQIGVLFTLTLVGDAGISLWITTWPIASDASACCSWARC